MDRAFGPATRTGSPDRPPGSSPGLSPGTSVPLSPDRTDKSKEETLPRLNQTGESASLDLKSGTKEASHSVPEEFGRGGPVEGHGGFTPDSGVGDGLAAHGCTLGMGRAQFNS